MTETEENLPDRPYDIFLNKTVFLTGGTGFLGKVIIERLLRLFEVKRIYILIRNKNDKDAESRLQATFSDALFDTVRKIKGDEIFRKCKAITGDVTVVNLNISLIDRLILRKEVDYVIHSAATVRFDEPLKTAIAINTKGTQHMLELAKEMEKLQVFVYVSTAYCHPEEKVLYEQIYRTSINPEHIIQMMDWLDEKQIETMTPGFLGDMPNTYAFSKALAERLVANEMENLPLIIVRPSIVVPIWKEPIPGWTDNINGPIGILVAGGTGVIRSMYGNKEAYADFISVDATSDYIFCCIAHSIISERSRKIFNLCTSNEVIISWGEVIEFGKTIAIERVPFDNLLWCPGGNIRKSKILHQLAVIFCQLLPALIIDALVSCFGYKPFLWKIQKRIANGMQVLEYYTSNQWTFNNDNTMYLRSWLNSKEKSIYTVTPHGFDMVEYFTNSTYAARRFILKQPDENLPRARRLMKTMYWLDKICNVIIKLLLAYLFYKLLLIIFNKT